MTSAVENLDKDSNLVVENEPKLKHVRTIIFDWSGVISDDRRPVYEANMWLRVKRGLPRIPFSEWFPQTMGNVHEYLQKLGFDEEKELVFKEYAQAFEQARRDGVHPSLYPDIKPTLEILTGKGLPLYVISSHPESQLIREAGEYGLSDLVSDLRGGITDKPNAILEICETLSLPTQHAAYIGDTIFDIHAARKAGVVSIGVTTGYHSSDKLRAENPDLLLNSLSELVAHLP